MKGGAQPSNQPSDKHKEQQKSKDSDRPTHTQKKRKEPPNPSREIKKPLTLRPFSKLQLVASSFSFIFFHHIPFLYVTAPSMVRERLSLASAVDFPASHSSARESSQHCEHSEQREPSDFELSQACIPHFLAEKVHGRVAAQSCPRKLPTSRKSATTSLDQSCPMTSIAWHSLIVLVHMITEFIPTFMVVFFKVYCVTTFGSKKNSFFYETQRLILK